MFEKCHLCGRSAGFGGAAKAGFLGVDTQVGSPLVADLRGAEGRTVWLCPPCVEVQEARVAQAAGLERSRLASLEKEQRLERLESGQDVDGLIEAMRACHSDEGTYASWSRYGRNPETPFGEALVRIGGPGVGPLVAVLEDTSEPVKFREYVCYLLGRIGDERALGALAQVFRGEENRHLVQRIGLSTAIKTEAATAIGTIGTPEAVQVVFGYIKDEGIANVDIEDMVTKALRALGPKAEGPLAAILEDEEYQYLHEMLSGIRDWIRANPLRENA